MTEPNASLRILLLASLSCAFRLRLVPPILGRSSSKPKGLLQYFHFFPPLFTRNTSLVIHLITRKSFWTCPSRLILFASIKTYYIFMTNQIVQFLVKPNPPIILVSLFFSSRRFTKSSRDQVSAI